MEKRTILQDDMTDVGPCFLCERPINLNEADVYSSGHLTHQLCPKCYAQTRNFQVQCETCGEISPALITHPLTELGYCSRCWKETQQADENFEQIRNWKHACEQIWYRLFNVYYSWRIT